VSAFIGHGKTSRDWGLGEADLKCQTGQSFEMRDVYGMRQERTRSPERTWDYQRWGASRESLDRSPKRRGGTREGKRNRAS